MLSQRDSMPDESPATQRRTSSATTAASAGSGASRQPSGSARTGIRPDGTVPPGNVPACRRVPGFAGRSLMSAGLRSRDGDPHAGHRRAGRRRGSLAAAVT